MAAKTFEFYSGEDKTLSVRLIKKELDGNIRPWTIPAGSTVTFTIPASPSDLSVAATIDNYDLGEISAAITDTQTALMKSGDLIITIVSGSVTRKSRLANGIIKLSL